MSWPDSLVAANKSFARAFAESILFQQAAAGSPILTVTVVRQSRDQTEQLGAYEQAWGTVGPAAGQFPVPPVKGDFVTIGTAEYVIHLAKPDQDSGSDGWRIYLAKRNPNHA